MIQGMCGQNIHTRFSSQILSCPQRFSRLGRRIEAGQARCRKGRAGLRESTARVECCHTARERALLQARKRLDQPIRVCHCAVRPVLHA